MHAYDPDHAPVSTAWLQLDEGERLEMASSAHRNLAPDHPPVESMRMHAAIHVTVENQLAAADPPEVPRTLERLVASGMTRHTAIHAIGMVVADEISNVLGKGKSFDEARYSDRLRRLTRESFEGGE